MGRENRINNVKRLRVHCSVKQPPPIRWPLHVKESLQTSNSLLSSRVRLFCPCLSDRVEGQMESRNPKVEGRKKSEIRRPKTDSKSLTFLARRSLQNTPG